MEPAHPVDGAGYDGMGMVGHPLSAKANLAARVVVLAAALGACDLVDGSRACTEIGCASGLAVQITGASTHDSVIVQVTDAASSANVQQTCADAMQCRLVFSDFTPADVVIQVTYHQQITTSRLTPNYLVSQPNGPDCPPVCRNFTAAIPLS